MWAKNNKTIASTKFDINIDEKETVQMKKLRLTKEYLSRLKDRPIDNIEEGIHNLSGSENDVDAVENDYISKKIEDDLMKKSGLQQRLLAKKINFNYIASTSYMERTKGIITCFVVSNDNNFLFVGYKSGKIKKILLSDFSINGMISCNKVSKHENPFVPRGHVLALALTSDSKYLASSNEDCLIHIWDGNSLKLIKSLDLHQGYITSLSFRVGSYTLYSGSTDKSIKIWSINNEQVSYVDSLFGHEDSIADMSCLHRERLVSTGGIDKSVRYWKIPEASQLVFQHSSNQECVKLIDETNFISTTDDGTLLKWRTSNKQPQFTLANAHNGCSFPNIENIQSSEIVESSNMNTKYWITSLAVLPFSDICASGSHDGYVKIWSVSNELKLLSCIKLSGVIVSLLFIRDGQYLLIGVSRETKLGRWITVPKQLIQEGIHQIKLFD